MGCKTVGQIDGWLTITKESNFERKIASFGESSSAEISDTWEKGGGEYFQLVANQRPFFLEHH